MAHFTLGQDGVKAVENRDWDTAITKLTTALKDSKSPTWLIARSKAWIAKNEYTKSLHDAELAYHCANERGNRNLMAESQHRRGVALFRLGEYANADCCCVWACQIYENTSVSSEDEQSNRVDENGFYNVQKEEAWDWVKKGFVQTDTQRGHWAKNAPAWNASATLRVQILGALEKCPLDATCRKVTATKIPKLRDDVDLAEDAITEERDLQRIGWENKRAAMRGKEVKMDFYQTNDRITISLYARGIDKDTIDVEFHDKGEAITVYDLPRPDGTMQDFRLVTWEPIVVAECAWRVTPNKVELNLVKRTPGKWAKAMRGTDGVMPEDDTFEGYEREQEKRAVKAMAEREAHLAKVAEYGKRAQQVEAERESLSKLEGKSGEEALSTPAAKKQETVSSSPESGWGDSPPELVKRASPASSPSGQEAKHGSAKEPRTATTDPPQTTKAKPAGPPVYPTSSKKGPQNWDKLDLDDDEDDEGGKDVNHFFQKLYAGATPEQQRAMMKSFTESNGTALSTDWNDVKGRKVETQPPDGAVAKEW